MKGLEVLLHVASTSLQDSLLVCIYVPDILPRHFDKIQFSYMILHIYTVLWQQWLYLYMAHSHWMGLNYP